MSQNLPPPVDQTRTTRGDRIASGLLARLRRFWLGPTARKSYFSVADRFVVSGTNFLTVVAVGRFCGLDNLGIFALAWSLLLALNVIQEALVLSPFTVFVGRDSNEEMRDKMAGTALVLHWILVAFSMLNLLGGALLITISGAFPEFPELLKSSWLMLAVVPAVALREFIRRYLFTKLEAIRVFVLDLVVCVVQLAMIGTLGLWGWLTPSYSLLSICLACAIPSAIWMLRKRQQFPVPTRKMLASVAGEYWGFGRWICVGQLSDLTVTHGVTWLVAVLIGTAATGLYAACNSIVMVINPILLGLGSILLPKAAAANHQHGKQEVNRIIWKSTGLLTVTLGALCLVIAIFGEVLINSFFSLESVDQVSTLVAILVLANFISATGFAIDNGLVVVHRPDINFYASILGLVITLLTGLILTIQWGVIGTASGVLIGTFFNTLFQFWAFVRLVGWPGAVSRFFMNRDS